MITEISVSVPNRPNEMANILKHLAEAKINLLGFAIEPAGAYSIIRMICYPMQKAIEQLKKYAYSVEDSEIFAIRLPQEAGKLLSLTKLLGENEINIEHGYLTLIPRTNEAVVFLNTTPAGDDKALTDRAKQLLKGKFEDLSNEDLIRLSQG